MLWSTEGKKASRGSKSGVQLESERLKSPCTCLRRVRWWEQGVKKLSNYAKGSCGFFHPGFTMSKRCRHLFYKLTPQPFHKRSLCHLAENGYLSSLVVRGHIGIYTWKKMRENITPEKWSSSFCWILSHWISDRTQPNEWFAISFIWIIDQRQFVISNCIKFRVNLHLGFVA